MKGSPAGAQSLSSLEISRETKTGVLARIPAVTQENNKGPLAGAGALPCPGQR
jgi:hypothetical protein